MSNCNNKIKYGCGDSIYATCVNVESIPNTQSSLVNETCISQEDFNEDVYGQLEDIWSENDLEALGNLCLSYTLIGGKKVVKNVLLKYEEKICELSQELETLQNRRICDIPISECLADFDCLVGECDTSIVTLKDWMLAVQTKICTV